MIFDDDITLEHDRVRLEPLAEPHREPLWLLAQEPGLWAFVPSSVRSRPDWDRYIDQAMELRREHQRYAFAVIDRATGQPAGCTSYGNFSLYDHRVEIGWTWLGQPFRGTGINKAAKFLLLSFAFEKMDMRRVELKTDVRNHRSRAAIKGIGAKEEGVLRSHMSLENGHRRDTVYYSILDTEWPEVRRQLLLDLQTGTIS